MNFCSCGQEGGLLLRITSKSSTEHQQRVQNVDANEGARQHQCPGNHHLSPLDLAVQEVNHWPAEQPAIDSPSNEEDALI
jgi:hypothetical protein